MGMVGSGGSTELGSTAVQDQDISAAVQGGMWAPIGSVGGWAPAGPVLVPAATGAGGNGGRGW